MQSALDLTTHAHQRRSERQVPPSVMRELQTSAARFVGHTVNGHRVEYRITRHHDTYWIAPILASSVLTVYAKAEAEIRAWCRGYLVNPEQSSNRILRLPNHRTPNEAVTDELASMWLDSGGPMEA